jgi:MraZ protein
VFLGTYAPRLDEKGRIILPAKFRDELAGGLVMTRGQDRCVYVFSQRGFEGVHSAIQQATLSDKGTRDFLRLFLSGASDEIPDKQNRVTIPSHLRSYAGLDRDVTVIGVGTRMEIWDTAAWSTYYDQHEDEFAETSQEVIPGLL